MKTEPAEPIDETAPEAADVDEAAAEATDEEAAEDTAEETAAESVGETTEEPAAEIAEETGEEAAADEAAAEDVDDNADADATEESDSVEEETDSADTADADTADADTADVDADTDADADDEDDAEGDDAESVDAVGDGDESADVVSEEEPVADDVPVAESESVEESESESAESESAESESAETESAETESAETESAETESAETVEVPATAHIRVKPAAEYPRELPSLDAPRRPRKPSVSERMLDNGLRVVAVRRPGVPMVEVRLRVPFAGSGSTFLPRSYLLAETMLAGTPDKSTVDIAAELQTLGGDLSVGVDPDRLLVSGNALASGLPRLLGLLTEVLTTATYPRKEVDAERDRLADRLEMAASQASHVARKAINRRFYGDHPYAIQVPEPAEIRGLNAGAVRRLHTSRVVPDGATLVIVGDVTPGKALSAAESALSGWAGEATGTATRAVGEPELGPIQLVNRPGSVQSSIRLASLAVGRGEEEFPALQLANLVFGGYFSSRLVENIREDKGYTYSPHSAIAHQSAGSAIVVDADVATEVTAPALLEMTYELGRISAVPPTADELEQARQYAIGTQALAVASQSGLANTLSSLLGSGLTVDWLADHPANLRKVTVDDVYAAALDYLAPARAVTVVVGEAIKVEESLTALGPVELA